MKCHIVFRGNRLLLGETLSKDVELAAVPFIDCYVEYQDGWGLAKVDSVAICRNDIEVSCTSYFDADEMTKLESLGWLKR